MKLKVLSKDEHILTITTKKELILNENSIKDLRLYLLNEKAKVRLPEENETLRLRDLQTEIIERRIADERFLRTSDDFAISNDLLFFGWSSVNGAPLIRRYQRGSTNFQEALNIENYQQDWENRSNLNYGE